MWIKWVFHIQIISFHLYHLKNYYSFALQSTDVPEPHGHLLCFNQANKSSLISLASRKFIQKTYKGYMPSVREVAPPCNWKKLTNTYDVDGVPSDRFLSCTALRRAPVTWKLFRVRPKGYFMPASLQKIAWCVLNGGAEQRRHQHDEWIRSSHWHIRDQLIKAAGSKRACTCAPLLPPTHAQTRTHTQLMQTQTTMTYMT